MEWLFWTVLWCAFGGAGAGLRAFVLEREVDLSREDDLMPTILMTGLGPLGLLLAIVFAAVARLNEVGRAKRAKRHAALVASLPPGTIPEKKPASRKYW